MQKRRALLIGIPRYSDEAIQSFPEVVSQDVDNLERSLRLSGYHDISVHGLNDAWEATRPRILDKIEQFLKDATDLDTLVIYLSGHGLHHDGVDYLIPAEATIGDPSKYSQYLIKLDFADLVERSRAQTVIFFIDACRQGVALKQKASYAVGWGSGERKRVQDQFYMLVFACEPGEFAQYVTGDTSFSLFTLALSNVIAPTHPARTLGEVLSATDEELARLTREYKRNPQRTCKDFETGVSEDAGLGRIICEGTGVAIPAAGSVPWSAAALTAEIWGSEQITSDPYTRQLKDGVASVVEACWRQWLSSVEALPGDPWRDERLPLRILDSLSLLIHRSTSKIDLTASECALLTVAPFVREAVIASGVARAATAQPFSLETTGATEGPRGELEKTYLLFPQLVRKARRLEALGQKEARDSLAMWLMYRCVLRLPSLWLPAPKGTLGQELEASLRSVSARESAVVSEVFDFNRMIELSRCVFGDPERIQREDRPDALHAEIFLGGQAPERRVREQLLGHFLVLAGRLAIDPRLLSDVIVDHLGLVDSLTPKDVLSCLNNSHWARAGKILSLTVRCYHQAIDLALHDHVQDSFQVLNVVSHQEDTYLAGRDAINSLPARLTADGVKPALDENGRAVYETPHIRFHLAQDEVRELLMGAQLYGDPTLAIRELYQNALDACRYRRARLEFLKRTGQLSPAVSQWEGEIIFRQGTDEEGRPFIECEDNGVGMGRRELSECFANAGRRFHDTPEFIEEQAEWRKCNPPVELFPNSQFGIGVFSYFMLSDELLIETCRLDRNGFPGTRLTALVSGSGTLFRVTEQTGAAADAGTKIRLYLNRTTHNAKRISCADTLRELLWVAEFRVAVRDGDVCCEWMPNVLMHPRLPPEQIIAGSSPDLWWTTSKEAEEVSNYNNKIGAVLADGIHTGPKDNRSPLNFIVNLKAAHRPVLSVDRKKILEWDEAWVHRLLANGWHTLVEWPQLTLSWMWLLERESPEAAEQLTSALAERGASIAVGFVNWNVNEYAYNSLFRCDELLNEGDFKFQDLDWVGEKAPVGEVGCLPGDVDVFEYLHRLRIGKWTLFDDAFVDRKWRRSNWIFGRTRERLPDWLLTYRLALFKKLNVITWLPKWSAAERVTLPEHFPTLLPSDSEILSKLEQSLSVLDIASQTGDTLGATLQRLKRLSPLLSNPPDVDISPYEDATVTKDELNAVRHGRVALGWVLKTAAASGESVESVVQKLQKFTPFGITLPEISSGAAASVLEDKDNLRLFNEHGTITPTSIVLAAAYIKEPLSATIRRAQQFAALGVSIPQVKPEDFEGLMVEDHVRYVFSRLDVFGESILTGVARSSAATGETVGRILESLEKFRPLGIDIPDVEPRDVTDLVISDTDLQLLSYPYSSISLSKILEVSSEMGEPVNVTYGRAEKLAKLGFRLEKLDLSNVPEIRVSGVDLSHLDVSKNVSVHHLLTASAKAGVTVFEIYERYLRLAPLGVRVPKIDREAAKAISLGQSDLPLLWSDNRVTIFRLLAAACILREPFANTFERAKRLTAFGISVPKLNFTDLKLPIIDREDFLSLTAVGIIRAAASEKKTTVKLAQPVESLMTKLRKSFTKRGDNQEPRLESDTRLLAKVRRYLKESVEWSSTGRGAGLLRLAAKLDAVDFRLDTTVSRREINLVAFIMCEQTALVSARLQKFARFGLRVRGG